MSGIKEILLEKRYIDEKYKCSLMDLYLNNPKLFKAKNEELKDSDVAAFFLQYGDRIREVKLGAKNDFFLMPLCESFVDEYQKIKELSKKEKVANEKEKVKKKKQFKIPLTQKVSHIKKVWHSDDELRDITVKKKKKAYRANTEKQNTVQAKREKTTRTQSTVKSVADTTKAIRRVYHRSMTFCSSCNQILYYMNDVSKPVSASAEMNDTLYCKYCNIIYEKENAMVPSGQELEVGTQTLNKPQDHNLSLIDVVVRSHSKKCEFANHRIEDITVHVEILTKYGDIKKETTSASHCHDCKCYFISNYNFEGLKEKGTLLCRVVDETKDEHGASYSMFEGLSAESRLKQMGYSVAEKQGLEETPRRVLLALLIDKKIFLKYEIVKHLEYLIKFRQHQKKFDVAVGKWQSDISFVNSYKIGDYSQYGVKSIRKKIGQNRKNY